MDENIEKILPTPRKNESQSNFIPRCMSNAEMKREFPEQKRRLAVCFSQFRRKKKTVDEELDELKKEIEDKENEDE